MDLLWKLVGQTFIHFIIEYFHSKDAISSTNKKLSVCILIQIFNEHGTPILPNYYSDHGRSFLYPFIVYYAVVQNEAKLTEH